MRWTLLAFIPFTIAFLRGNKTCSDESIRGINIYGLETESRNFVCSWVNPISYYIDELNRLGFNSIRLPFSLKYVFEGNWLKIDEFMNAISKHPHMTVVLDLHRLFPDSQSPSPTDRGVTIQDYFNGWRIILERYESNKQVVAVDIFNEYQGNDHVYWNNIARQTTQYIENLFPGRFNYTIGGTNWGGTIQHINIEDVQYNDRVSYSVHKYIFSSFGNRTDNWIRSFGPFVNVSGKVQVGEWGFKNRPDEVEWAQQFVMWLKSVGVRDSYFWTIAHSHDTDGLWLDNCRDIDMVKYRIIRSSWC